MQNNFTQYNTNIIKGVAIIMLFIHHLFFLKEYPYIETNILGLDFWNTLAIISKTCVNIFLILSGYGLYKSFSKSLNIINFYKKHFLKIYTNYWLIWILFVPIGIIFYNLDLNKIYTHNLFSQLLCNFLGFQIYFNFWGINPTWWFISLILGLYLLFPLLYKCSKKNYLIEIIFFISLVGYFFHSSHLLFLNLLNWPSSFIIGIITAKYSVFEKVKTCKSKLYKPIICILLILLCITRVSLILTKSSNAGQTTIFNIFIALFIIIITFLLTKQNNIFNYLEKLGQKSFYLFLFHTFIFGIYWNEYTYSLKYPILILINFIIINLAIAQIIDCLKKQVKQIINQYIKKEQ